MALLNAGAVDAVKAEDLEANLQTFSSAPELTIFSGPLSLFRIVGVQLRGGKKERTFPSGRFWTDQSLIEQLEEDFVASAYSGGEGDADRSSLIGVRDDLAISYEWNSMDSVAELRIPEGSSLEGFVGPADRQPERLAALDGRHLSGGATQYLIYGVDKLGHLITVRPFGTIWRNASRRFL